MSASPAPELLRGIDRAAFATSFGLRLRGAGLDVGVTAIETFARALEAGRPDRRTALYWSGRLAFTRRREDLATYDAVFAAVFDQAVRAVGDPARPARPRSADEQATADQLWSSLPRPDAESESGQGLPWLRLPRAVGAAEDPAGAIELPERWPSALSAIADKSFADLDPADLARLDAWLGTALERWPNRRSRRLADHHAGHRISLRRTIAGSRRTGFQPVELHRVRPVRKPRRLLMLCDVSQSMEPYAAAYLQLMRSAARVTRAEVFAFSTSLTRLTTVLRHRSPEVAIELAGERVVDRFGGTRIAANVRALLASHHADAARGAIVVIASDGWDSDDPADLAIAMRRLHRRAHRVIWLNPRAGSPGFEPLVGGLAAALPYCDLMLPARTLRDIEAVLDAITEPTPTR